MKITGFIANQEMARNIVRWCKSFANHEDEIQILCYEKSLRQATSELTKVAMEELEMEAELESVYDPMVVKATVEFLRKSKSELLITGSFVLPSVEDVDQNSDELIKDAPCQTFVALYGNTDPLKIKKAMFLTTGYVHDRPGVKLLKRFGRDESISLTVAIIEENTSTKAEQTGELTVKSIIHDAGFEEEDFEIVVEIDRLKHRGILKCAGDNELIIAGMDTEKYLLPLENSLNDANVAITKRSPPLRLRSFVEWLPRINPADHADLVHELRQGSNWSPDFIVMLGLAAAVSTLGLMQDSPAVVIGSMLLAPLMTPMMGLGLALAQANTSLMRKSLKSIVLGVLLTVTLSFLLGFLIPSGDTLTNEVLGRGTPNVLDLMIALFAAGAAAFAMARPSIVGAIAGVAIATVLVPPACSVGISLAHGSWLNAMGASLLFFANLIAIITASSFTFMVLGISSVRALKRNQRTARLGQIALILVLVVLFAPMSIKLITMVKEGKNVPLAYPVTTAVANALNEKVDQTEGVDIMVMAQERITANIRIHLATDQALPSSFADELTEIVREEMNNPNQRVKVIAVQKLWTNSD